MGRCPHLTFLVAKQRLLVQNYKTIWVPDPTCGFSMQNNDFWYRITSLYGSQTWPVIFTCTTAWLASDLLVSMGRCPHLTFLHANLRLLDKHTSLCGIQISPVSLCKQNSVPSIRITSLYGSQTSSAVLCIQKSDFRTWIVCLYVSQQSSVVYACKTATFGREYKSLWVPDLTCRFVQAQRHD